jgi:hypothetical protein
MAADTNEAVKVFVANPVALWVMMGAIFSSLTVACGVLLWLGRYLREVLNIKHANEISNIRDKCAAELEAVTGRLKYLEMLQTQQEIAFITRHMPDLNFVPVSRFKPAHNLLSGMQPLVKLFDENRFRALSNSDWDEEITTNEAIFHTWFGNKLERDERFRGALEEFHLIAKDRVFLWKGPTHPVGSDHKFLENMYPFVIVASIPIANERPSPTDFVSNAVFVFLDWIYRFVKVDPTTSFKITNMEHKDDVFYLQGHFNFANIKVGGRDYASYYLMREIFVFKGDGRIYTILSGVPNESTADRFFASVTTWLNHFQVG